jgi:hypothetical protein
MRPILFLCAATALLGSGCASCIARSGLDPERITTREQAHEIFGEPVASGTRDGQQYEDFRYHAKVAENARAVMLMYQAYQSVGLADFVYTPVEAGRAGWNTLRGYDIHFQYDASGAVTKYTVEGLEGMAWPLR